MAWYVVFRGRRPGIYTDWPSCQAQVSGYRGCIHQKFPTHNEAVSAYNSFFGIECKASTELPPQRPTPPTPRDGTCIGWKDVVIICQFVVHLLLIYIILSLLGKESK